MSQNRIYVLINGGMPTKDIIDITAKGADGLVFWDAGATRADIEPNAAKIKEIVSVTDVPITAFGGVGRFEDVKKLIYAGADKVVVDTSSEAGLKAYDEAVARFGKERVLTLTDYKPRMTGFEAEDIKKALDTYDEAVVSSCEYSDAETESVVRLRDVKKLLAEMGVSVRGLVSSIPFAEFKKDNNGLVPCIAQDYKTNEVLMLAYMNEESYARTIETGLMTYYSRSRNKLWTKGEESGHFQYVKELIIDCDKDTILAKVHQIGPACHTGNETCFFTPLTSVGDKDLANPFSVFTDVYNTIIDRRENPREGSYTNYLFDQGIDKILKKFGEEATETVIAAKNPDPSEIKYEISDLMYHMMVLMADKGITWEDITRELAERE